MRYILWLLIFPFIVCRAQDAKLMMPIGHTGQINYAHLCLDGKRLLTASGDGTVKLWDAETGQLLLDLKNVSISDISGSKPTAKVSPDGKTFITFSVDSTVKLWDCRDARLLNVFKGHQFIDRAYFAGDGTKIFCTSEFSMACEVFDVKTGTLLLELFPFKDIKDTVDPRNLRQYFTADITPDGKEIIATMTGQSIRVWDAETGVFLRRLAESESCSDVRDCKDCDLIVGCMHQTYFDTAPSVIKVWSLSTGKKVASFTGPLGQLRSMDLSADGKKLVTTCHDTIVDVWDVYTGRRLLSLKGHHQWDIHAMFSPDGEKIVTASKDSTVKVWQTSTGTLLNDFKCTEYVTNASLIKEGNNVLMVTEKQAIIADLETNRITRSFTGHALTINSVNFYDTSGRYFITAGQNSFQKWNVLSLTPAKRTGTETQFFSYNGRFSSDGKYFVSCRPDNTIKVLDIETGETKLNIKNWDSSVMTYAEFSPDRSKILTAGPFEDDSVKIWSASTGKLLTGIHCSEGSPSFLSATFSDDSKKIVTRDWSNGIKIWSAETGDLIHNVVLNTIGAPSILFSDDSTKLIAASYDSSVIVDIETGQIITDSSAIYTGVNAVVYSNDKSKVATVRDTSVTVRDCKSLAVLYELKGHNGYINSVTFSPDNTKILTSSQDNTCKMWNAKTGKLLYTFLILDSTDYLVYDSLYRYDGTEAARKLLYFTCGAEVIGLDQVKDLLWVPNLAERIMRGETINAPTLSDIHICGLTPLVEHIDSIDGNYYYNITPRKGGLGETAVYVNSIEVARYKPEALTKTPTGYLLTVADSMLKPNFVTGHSNLVKVRSFTAQNDIASRDITLLHKAFTNRDTTTNLYAIMIGVSDYKGDDIDLKYAAKDASDMAAVISASARKLLDIDDKEHVFVYNLTTNSDHYLQPEKKSIKKVLDSIGKKATANDVLFVFFAGHGVMHGDNKLFYFLTADASMVSATGDPGAVGISTQELSDWIQPANIKAQKRVLVFDACNSGEAINELVKIGGSAQNYLAARNDEKAEQIKALEKLNEKSGLFILAASASNQSAYEFGQYEQGLLTYALLKVIKEQPDILEKGKYLDVNRWFTTAEKTVTSLAEESGAVQNPQIVTAGDFNIGIVDAEILAQIRLPQVGPLFTGSNFQNEDDAIAFDDMDLNKAVNAKLAGGVARGSNNTISYVAMSASPEAYSISGRYRLNNDTIIARVIIRQGKAPQAHFEITGDKKNLDKFADEIVSRAVALVEKK